MEVFSWYFIRLSLISNYFCVLPRLFCWYIYFLGIHKIPTRVFQRGCGCGLHILPTLVLNALTRVYIFEMYKAFDFIALFNCKCLNTEPLALELRHIQTNKQKIRVTEAIKNCFHKNKYSQKWEGKPSETDSIKFKISSKTPRGKKNSTKKTPS